MSVRKSISALAAAYTAPGDPLSVLAVIPYSIPLDTVAASDVLVQFKSFPINPADINLIQGVYPVTPAAPFSDKPAVKVPGNEGLAKVIAKGSSVHNLNIGDWVLPVNPGFGTWRTHALSDSSQFMRVSSNKASQTMAATITVNPCTGNILSFFFSTSERWTFKIN